MRAKLDLDNTVAVLGSGSRAQTIYKTQDPKLDAEGRQLYSTELGLFDPEERSMLIKVETTTPADSSLVPGSAVRVVDAEVHVYLRQDGQLGAKIVASKIVSAAAPARAAS